MSAAGHTSARVSACEAAKTERAIGGLAEAFLAAGSAYVLAPTRVVDDAQSAALMTRLYGSWPNGGALDGLATALGGGDPLAYRVLSSGW